MRYRFSALLLASGLVWGCGGSDQTVAGVFPGAVPPAPVPVAAKATTVLVYMNGSDLEESGSASKNLRDALAAPFPTDVSMAFCTGGAKVSDANAPVRSWRTVKRHLLTAGNLQELDDLGSVSMDSGDTLAGFIEWGVRSYPAQRYVLILWDHGSGYLGFGGDRVNPGSGRRMAQADLVQAIGRSPVHFDLIGFDACLMATEEISNPLARRGNYMVASQQTEPGEGWDYKALVSALAADARVSAPALARIICDSYFAQIQTPTSETLSVLDLREEAQLGKLLENFAVRLRTIVDADQLESIEKALVARSLAYDFQKTLEMVDVVDGMEKFEAAGVLAAEARAIREQASREVIYNRVGSTAARAHGLSVYFPYAAYSEINRDGYAALNFLDGYKQLVASIYAWVGSEASAIQFSNVNYDQAGALVTATVASRLGLQNLQLALSVDPPESELVRFVSVAPSTVLPQTTLQPVNVSLPVAREGFRWDGHRIDLVPDQETPETASLRTFLLEADWNGQPSQIRILEDRSGGTPVYSVKDVVDALDVDRSEPVLPTDRIRTFSLQYDRSKNLVGTRPFEEFAAGTMVIERAPLASGPLYLYLLFTDLRGGLGLSTDRILLQ